jgi:hypothetical protein
MPIVKRENPFITKKVSRGKRSLGKVPHFT